MAQKLEKCPNTALDLLCYIEDSDPEILETLTPLVYDWIGLLKERDLPLEKYEKEILEWLKKL